MTRLFRPSTVIACMLSGWLALFGTSCQNDEQVQETKQNNLLQEQFEKDGDPPPSEAVVHTQKSDFWHPETVRWAAFSPDSQTLLSLTNETLYRWTVPAGELVSETTLKGISRNYPMCISPDDRTLASVDNQNFQCHLWDLKTGKRRHTFGGLGDRLGLLGFSPDSKSLLTFRTGTVHVWDAASGKKLREWNARDQSIWATHFFPDNQTVLMVDRGLVVRRWDYSRGKLLDEKELKQRSDVHTAQFSPDGKLLAVTASLHEVGGVYDVQTGSKLFELKPPHGGWMYLAGFLPNSETLITQSHGKDIALWDVSTGELKSTFRAEADDAFTSPDGRWLAIRPDAFTWGREIRIWNPKTGQQVSAPRMRTYLRPVVSRLAPADPMQVAIHWAHGSGRIPRAGRYLGEYSQAAILSSMTVRVVTPSGTAYQLHPQVTKHNTEFSDYRLRQLHDDFYEIPSIFLELDREGFKTLVLGNSGTWKDAEKPAFDEVGEYRVSISGQVVIGSHTPIPFQTDEVKFERIADGVLPLAEVRKRALAKLEDVLGGDRKIIPDDGDWGEYAPIDLVGLPTHERAVFLAVHGDSHIAGGRHIDRYRVVVEPGGRVVGITHARQQTCVAAGTLVDTEQGPRPIEQLTLGDRVWSYDLRRNRPLLAVVRAVHQGEASAVVEIDGSLLATAEHPVYANGQWTPAGQVREGDLVVGRTSSHRLTNPPQVVPRKAAVFDLTVDEPHNFFAGGLLVHNKSVGFSPGSFDRWKVFHVAGSAYPDQIWPIEKK